MREGIFTDGVHKLRDHISGKKCDYLNARRIVNGLDHCDDIANYAEQIELLLRLCAGPTSVPSNPGWLRVEKN